MGDKIQFRKGIWVGNQPLNELFFSRLATLSNSCDNVLSDMGEWRDGTWNWKIS